MSATVIQTEKPRSFIVRLLLGRHPKRTFVRIAILITASLIIFKVILLPVRITGNSMEPTCYNRQIGFVNRLAYSWNQPRRGDIIGFHPENDQQIIVKRIIGLPGERIAFHSGVVHINGKRIVEPYLISLGAWEWPEETLGDNVYFVTGDNREISQQFRVAREKIMGKIYSWHP